MIKHHTPETKPNDFLFIEVITFILVSCILSKNKKVESHCQT